MIELVKWFIQVLLWPAFLSWLRDAAHAGKLSPEFKAKVLQTVEAYENASTREERRAARRALMGR